jgi:hypothetical protein
MKFPELAVTTMPAIPTQQAIVVYRDGLETLIIESTYETESQTVGWVLPLPAEPTDLAVADNGMMTSLAWCLQPEVVHDVTGIRNGVVLLVLAVLVLPAIIAIFVKGRTLFLACWFLCTYLFLILPLGLGTAGSSLSASPRGLSGITTLSAQRIGNYEVSVLRADDSSALAGWLAANGLRRLDDRARAIVDDYIADKWVFAVAKLQQQEDGPATPHPIAATFATDQPIYPMKLTALADTTLHLELFVIADRRASAVHLKPLVADRFEPCKERSWALESLPQPYFRTRSEKQTIGHPDVCELMWPGCVVTRLAGRISPTQMDRDIHIGLRDHASAYQRTLFSPNARRDIAITCIAIAWAALVVAVATVYRNGRRPTRIELRITAGLLIGVLAIVGVFCAALPVIPVRTGGFLLFGPHQLHYEEKCAWAAIGEGALHAGMRDEQIARYPELRSSWLDSSVGNLITGDEMKLQRSPGNFHVRRIDGKVYFCLYDQHAREYRIELDRPRQSR